MAVAFDAVGPSAAGAGINSASTLTWNHTVGAALSNPLLLVGAAFDYTNDAGVTASCTVDGSATGVVSLGVVHANGATTGFLQVWVVTGAGAASGSHTVAVTATSSAADIEGGSLSFSGAGGTGTPVTGHSLSGTSSAAVTAATTSIIAGFTAAGDSVSSSGNTSRFIINQATSAGDGVGNAAGATAAGTGSPVTMSWTLNSSTTWAALAVEVLIPAIFGPPSFSAPPNRAVVMAGFSGRAGAGHSL